MKPRMLIPLLAVLTGCAIHSRSLSSQNRTSHSTTGIHQPADSDHLELVYRIEGNNAILDSDRLTFIFPNLPAEARNSFNFQQGKISIQIAGPGTSTVSVVCQNGHAESTFQSVYENGTNSITFCGREVRLANRGKAAMTLNETVDTSTAKQQLIVTSARK